MPSNLLRLIDRHVNFEFIRTKLKDSYSDTGRPSIDPELLLRLPALAEWNDQHRQPFTFLTEASIFCRSVVRQGMLGDARATYWKFLIDAATRYRHAFGAAVTLAIMGYHFYTVTEEACRTV